MCSAVRLTVTEDATLEADDGGGIENGELVSIVVLAKGGLDTSTFGAPQDGEGFDGVASMWTDSVTVIVYVEVILLTSIGAAVLAPQS
jgi:hypothetical protein